MASGSRHGAGSSRAAKRLGRRSALRALGIAAGAAALPRATPLSAAPSPAPKFRPLGAAGGPRAFSAEELRTLGELVETILPATDTPGAREAGVHHYLDDVAAAEPDVKNRVRDGLRRLDERCWGAFGKPFVEASEDERVRVLQAISGEATVGVEVAFFKLIKSRVVEGYYRSEAGQMGELQWVGHGFFDAFPGVCTHPDPFVHPRPRFESARKAGAVRGETS